VWGAVAGVSLGAGPLVGGALVQLLGWRAIFWINLPVGLAALGLAAAFVPESKAARARAFDPIGQILVFAGLTALVYAVIEGPRTGWTSPRIDGLFLAAAAILAAFVTYERRRPEPLVDLRFFRSVPFTTAAVLALCAFASFAGFLFLNALYLQQERGLPAFQAGLCTLPLAILMVVCAPVSGRLVGDHGPRPSLLLAGGGFLLSTLILTQLGPATPLPLLLFAYALYGVGLGMVNPAITNSAVAGMPLAQAGVAAAIASTSRQVGAALGVAIAGTVVNADRTSGGEFSRATHPIWWIMSGCGAITLLSGWVAGQPWGAAPAANTATPSGSGPSP
jgi:MFS family permease